MINRLNFSLPEFTRIVWVSEEAREIWEPRIAAINAAWIDIERATVFNGLRRGGLQGISPGELVLFQSWCADNNLDSIIIAQEGVSKVYGNASVPMVPGMPWNYRVYFGDSPRQFLKFWRDNDDLGIGGLLGYPICCTQFFKQFWTNEGWRDLTYPMLRYGTIDGPYTCNILLRHIGIRPVFHLPCSLECDITRTLGERIIATARQVGFKQEMMWLEEMLKWPIRWSSLHGAAVITIPILKVVASSDPLEFNAVFDRAGKSYPAEGATGVEFPFQKKKPLKFIRNTWTANGFSGLVTMTKAHDVVLAALHKIKDLKPGRMFDLGCGNGVLIDRIHVEFPNLDTYGIEIDTTKSKSANIIIADLFDFEFKDKYEVIHISVNRFNEGGEEKNEDLLHRIQDSARFLIVSSYDPWIGNFDSLIAERFDLLFVEGRDFSEVRVYANPKF